ncbi:MAG: hypothetical protein M3003_12005 [Candidatus Dormibacteraeota bacterium]|nr:hypothetical protein [Candidatus Dormibacteraeota bacterium]
MTLADLVRGVVDHVRPENVDPAGTVVTGEGPDVEIVIVAHRDLGGVSLVAWTDARGARLLWATVRDLSRHDDLDLGTVVESISYDGDWGTALRAAFAAELRRPIRLRSRTGWLRGPRVECSIVSGGRDRRIGVIRLPKNESRSETVTTTLAGGSRPWFSVPPAISHGR